MGLAAVGLGALGVVMGGWAFLSYSAFKAASKAYREADARYERARRADTYASGPLMEESTKRRDQMWAIREPAEVRAAIGIAASVLGFLSALIARGGSEKAKRWGLMLSIAGAIFNGILSGEFRGWT